MSSAEADPGGAAEGERTGSRATLFAVTWAAAVLFHVAGNPRAGEAWSRGLVGVAAVALLAKPRSRLAHATLAVAVLVTAWAEAPGLSNHFLLQGFVALAVLGGLATWPDGVCQLVCRVGGPLRLLLLAFYAFAAFAKLNTDFFDPVESCARFYLEEAIGSWGLGGVTEGWTSGAHRSVAVVVAGIELAVAALLVVRRTRSAGVLVALAFHFLLALDRSHQFFDFSSVLACLFLLFLPEAAVRRATSRLVAARDHLARRWSSGPELLRLGGLAAALGVVGVAAGPVDWPAPPLLRSVGIVAWIGYGLGTLVLAWVAVRTPHAAPPTLLPAATPRLLLAVPFLAVLNGLTPYLEVKTGASWNMYSNLAVVDGESNHLLVRSGVPLTDAHERIVRVESASGVDLGFYERSDWQLPEVTLLDHLAGHPGATVEGTVDGERVRYEGGGDARPAWREKLQVFRAVDLDGAVGCQVSFGPAR